MFRAKIFLLLALCWAQLSLAQRHHQRFEALDVQHYRFSLSVNDSSDVLTGVAEVTILFKQDMQTLTLDLQAYDDWNGKGMKVSSVELRGKAQKFEQEDDELRIILRKRAWKGEEHTIQIAYSGIPEEGLIITQNKFGDRVFFGENWPDRGKSWLPLVDHPSDKATVEFIVSAPDHYQVIANGRLLSLDRSDGYSISHWSEEVLLPTKVMVIGVAPLQVDSVGFVGDVPVTTWVFPQNAREGFYDFEPAATILEYFIDRIGKYPYQKLANVQSKTRFGGMENASNIFYFENSVTGKREREYLIAHEIAHQWFGNDATEGDWHHIWLSEGFATYMTNVYAGDTYGPKMLAERMATQRERVVNFAKQYFAPVVDTSVEEYEKLLNANSYQKGSWVLHMLRRQLGDDTFFKGISAYYERFKGRNALTADFRQVMEVVSGTNLETFFKQWLHQAGHPVITIERKETNGEVVFTIEQLQEELFEFDLELRLLHHDNTTTDLRLEVEKKSEDFKVEVDREVSEVIVDPDSWLLHELVDL